MPSISATRCAISRARHAFLLQAEGDVLLHRHVREQRVGLEHHVDRPLVRRDAGHVHAVDEDAARGGLLEAGQHAQQVVLPQPEPPSRQKISPRRCPAMTSSTAVKSPNFLVTFSMRM